jgi:transposase
VASFQIITSKGFKYLRIVESFRDPITKRPKLRVLRHLGRADNALAIFNSAEHVELSSRSHGAVAAVWQMAELLDLAGIIDAAVPGARLEDGLSLGQTLALAAVGRACRATSKRGFAHWAETTTLGDLAGVDISRLTSQHFWDQMNKIPVSLLPEIESALVQRVAGKFSPDMDTVLYDATNFFTFLASTNKHAKLPARGHNKQKRHDLRQVGVALCCTRSDAIPLFHSVYGGERPDVRVFADVFPKLRERLVAIGSELDALTVVYDKGNVSRVTQAMVDESELHYVAALTAASQRQLVTDATPQMEPLVLSDEETVTVHRVRRVVWGAERTLVVLCSPRLQQGQRRGIEQHIASAVRWLEELKATLDRGRQRRTLQELEAAIKQRLRRQHLREILLVELRSNRRSIELQYKVDTRALDELERTWLGRLVLMTDQHGWSTEEIIRAYRGQSAAESVFRSLKDPLRLAIRPQYHWTDQKIHIHAFICVTAYLLSTLVHLTAKRKAHYSGSADALFEQLTNIRSVKVLRPITKGRARVTEQLESMAPGTSSLLEALGITALKPLKRR